MAVKWKVLRQVAKLSQLGFFARLSNIILIQGVFVFAAVALLVLFPRQDGAEKIPLSQTEANLQALTERVQSIITDQGQTSTTSPNSEKTQLLLSSLFLPEREIAYAEIIVPQGDRDLARLFSFQRPWWSDGSGANDLDFSEAIDNRMIKLAMEQTSDILIPPIRHGEHSVCYLPFHLSPNQPAVLVTVTEEDLVISNRSQLQYALFVLFLCSTLVSLLTLYFIANRFKGPLHKLIHGFEKTASGELYYLLEPKGDSELQQLTTAYNNMSRALWRNQQKLRQYNQALKNTNMSLLESQLFLTTLIDSSPFCIVTASPEGKIMIFNRQAAEVFGYDREEIIGREMSRLLTGPTDGDPVLQPASGHQPGREVLCRRRDDSIFPAYLIAAPILTEDERSSAYLYIIRDISESKSFQEMMIRLDRYYTRGEIAGQIAHEINNYLTVLSGNMELIPLLLKRGETDKVQQRIDLMALTVEKIARFSDGLMDTAPDQTRFEPTDLNQLVENAVAFLKPQNKFDNITITSSLSTDLPLVELDVSQIQQVLVNLLYNSAEALQDRSDDKRIRITTGVVADSTRRIARIEVKDNGAGVLDDKEPLLFVKRFTTKRKGHGIGLITCRRIVEAHDGRITYRKGEGAVFSVEIPLKKHHASAITAPETDAQPSSQPV